MDSILLFCHFSNLFYPCSCHFSIRKCKCKFVSDHVTTTLQICFINIKLPNEVMLHLLRNIVTRPLYKILSTIYLSEHHSCPKYPLTHSSTSSTILFTFGKLNPIFSATANKSFSPGLSPFPLTVVACSPPMELL